MNFDVISGTVGNPEEFRQKVEQAKIEVRILEPIVKPS